MTVPFRIAIPARFDASRFPGKPLAPLAGRPMLEHVWERAKSAGAAEVVIATDDARIAEAATGFGAEVCMTGADHATGTDRLAETAAARRWPDDAIVVNLQGDEPLTPPELLAALAANLAAHSDAAIATLCAPHEPPAAGDGPDCVKVVTDCRGYALYFSRAAIPHQRQPGAAPLRRHLGLYAYRAGFLRQFSALEPAAIERAEQLEQLRALWHGHRIHVGETDRVPAAGVDTPDDLERVEAALLEQGNGT